MRRLFLTIVFAVGGVSFGGLAVGCGLPQQHLARATRAFEQNSHERTLAILRDLEPDYLRLSEDERARYAYLRGMTDYRMGYRIDARYWLACAKAMAADRRDALLPEWRTRLESALSDINEEVFDRGVESLENTLRRGGGESHPAAKRKSQGGDEP